MVPVVLITTIVCAAIATTISWYFVTHSTPLVVPAVAACCGAFVLSSLVLLPADAFAGRGAGLEGLIGFWRTLYWAAFILGLLATHTLHELLVAGEFSRVGRLRAAVRASLRLYAMMLACAIVGCVWMLFVMGISPVELPNVVMILINSYGMVLLALLQGRGMVEVPRQLWRRALPRDELSHRYYVLGAVDEMRDASATKLRELLAKVAAANAAAPAPTSRSAREHLCWDALLRSGRKASAECHLDEHKGGVLENRLRSVWAHSVGRPRVRDEAALAKLRRRVRAGGAVARRAWQRRGLALERAVSLCERLTSNEAGFGGAGIGRSRGLWLGLLRAPLLRALAALAALASGWLLLNEACSVVRLLPEPFGTRWASYCPAPWLDSVLVDVAPASACLLQWLSLHHAAGCALHMLHASHKLAPWPLLPRRSTDGASLLQHAAWLLRLTGPFASHFLIVFTAEPAATAFAAALGSIWHMPRSPASGAGSGSGAEAEPEIEPEIEFDGAMSFHGLCSALTVAASAAAFMHACSCSALFGIGTDAAHRYRGANGQRAVVKRGERLARAHLAARGAILAAEKSDPFGSSVGGALRASLGGASFGGGGAPLSTALLSGEARPGDASDEDVFADDEATPVRRNTPSSASAAATSLLSRGHGAGSNGHGSNSHSSGARGSERRAERTPSASERARSMWSFLIRPHGGGYADDEDDEDEGHGSEGGNASGDADDARDDRATLQPSWAPASWTTGSWSTGSITPHGEQSCCGGGGESSAAGVWESVRQRNGSAPTSASGGGGNRGGGRDIGAVTGANSSRGSSSSSSFISSGWFELTPFTSSRANEAPSASAPKTPSETAEQWRRMRENAF